MAANEVIELDSGSSSDDEFKDPPRKPIGWNYQGTASNNLKFSLVTPDYKSTKSLEKDKFSLVTPDYKSTKSLEKDKFSLVTPDYKSTKSLEKDKDMFLQKGCIIPKVNGTVPKPDKAEGNVVICNDEIEIMEVSPVKNKPSPEGRTKGDKRTSPSSSDTGSKRKGHIPMPASSSRAEIRNIIRGTTQSNISKFFPKTVKTDTDSKTRIDETVKSVSQNNGTETKKKQKLTTVSDDSKESVKVDDKEKRREEEKEKRREEEKEKRREEEKEKRTEEKKEERVEEDKNDDEDSETSITAVETFVSRWEELKSSTEDQKIRDKLWKYYYLAHSSYTHSKKFIGQVERSTRKLSIDNIYVVVKDLLDSLKCYKDRPYRDPKLEMEEQKKNGEASAVASPLPEETEEDVKRNKKLRKVEKKMKEISDKIKELETQDNDLDDEDNSAYLIEDRLKRQFSKLHDYYCKMAECTPATGRPIERKFRYGGSRYEEVNKRISAWVNKTKEFPDYVDILNLLKKVTKESMLPLRPETVRVQAQEIFRDVGRLLKDRRETDDLYSIYSYIDDAEEDPANKDDDLSKKLTENEAVAKEKLDKIFQEYVEKEAEARATADIASAKKTDEQTGVNKEDETKSTNPEDELKPVGRTEETEGQTEEEDEDLDDYEVEDDAGAEDSDGDESVEEIDDREVMEDTYARYDDDDDLGEETDDELRDVIASASVEEEFSEEDVPVIDSEEMKYRYEDYEEDEGSPSSIVCLDDTSSDSTTTLDKTTDKTTHKLTENENLLPARAMDSNCKKRQFDEDFSPQKKLCTENPNP